MNTCQHIQVATLPPPSVMDAGLIGIKAVATMVSIHYLLAQLRLYRWTSHLDHAIRMCRELCNLTSSFDQCRPCRLCWSKWRLTGIGK